MSKRVRMPRSITALIVSVAISASTTFAQAATVARGWRAAPAAAIKIHAPSGVLDVEGWARDSVSITGTLAKGETLFGGGSVTGLKLGSEGTATSGATRLLVRVPIGSRLAVRSGAANVEVRGVTGTIDVGSAAGDVRVAGAIESVTIESISGSVQVVATTPSVRARTTRGTLDIAGRIDEAQLTSVSGPVTVSTQSIGRLRIETVDGRVTVRGRLAASGSLDIESFGGPVHLEFPHDQRAALDLRASSGEISGRIDRQQAAGPPHNLGASVIRNGTAAVVVRAIGAGGGPMPPVTVRTFRGRITIDAIRPRT